MGIKVGKKKLKSGNISLFLDYNFKGVRHREYLQIKLEPLTSRAAKERNRQRMDMAEAIRFSRELEWLINEEQERNKTAASGMEEDFLSVFSQYIANYRNADVNTCRAVMHHLQEFTGMEKLSMSRITRDFCQQFYDYLLSRLRGTTPAGYFKKFRYCLQHCVEQGLLPDDPTRLVKIVTNDEFTKSILTHEEIALLAHTPCRDHEVKRAFLFACYTGLRWCDVSTLTYASVDLSHRMLHFTQQKVRFHSSRAVLHLTLSHTALQLLQTRSGAESDRVFTLPSYTYMLRILRHWCSEAGLSKHITFHCARHSFITNLMANGTNIKTAAELAGHSTIRHTEKYVHVSDRQKREAVESLPALEIEW